MPFAYPQSLPDLKSFVLIGLPASEAGSALLLPLAAHELGHAVWRNRGIEGPVNTTLQLKIEELFKTSKDTGEFKRNFPAYDDGDFVKAQIYPETIGETLGICRHDLRTSNARKQNLKTTFRAFRRDFRPTSWSLCPGQHS